MFANGLPEVAEQLKVIVALFVKSVSEGEFKVVCTIDSGRIIVMVLLCVFGFARYQEALGFTVVVLV